MQVEFILKKEYGSKRTALSLETLMENVGKFEYHSSKNDVFNLIVGYGEEDDIINYSGTLKEISMFIDRHGEKLEFLEWSSNKFNLADLAAPVMEGDEEMYIYNEEEEIYYPLSSHENYKEEYAELAYDFIEGRFNNLN